MLDLSANAIEALPPLAVALPALAEMILDDNSLRALGNELVGLSKLKKLSARSNRIAAVDPFSGEQVDGILIPEGESLLVFPVAELLLVNYILLCDCCHSVSEARVPVVEQCVKSCVFFRTAVSIHPTLFVHP